ncbi:MAG: hypothetical protein ACRBN8_32690 [Nannocystales bacterium]
MNTTSLIRASVLLCLAVSGCLGDDLSVGGSEPLDPEDVDDISEGDAVGDAASGAYLFTAYETRACSCRSGSTARVCENTELAGDGLWLLQNDGALQARLFNETEVQDDVVLHGGIDADGELRLGGVNTVTEFGEPVGQAINDVEGTLEPGGRGELTWRYRVEAVLGSESLDCDVVVDVSVAWWDPDAIESCTFASDCHPDRPFCVQDVCSTGEAGTECTLGSDCASGVCEAGACAGAEDCEAAGCSGELLCFEGSCQLGAEGDACMSAIHCAQGLKCTEGTCSDGSEGDACGSSTDCSPEASRCHQGTCQDGSEGDPCESAAQCSADASICFEERCQDGGAGDPCESNFECATLDGLSCSSSGVCA